MTDSSITIDWEEPANGGSAITGYQIQVWDDGDWMDLMSVGGSVTSYEHSGLPGVTQHYYQVRATNAVGDGPWSETHNATTTAGKPGAPVLAATANGSSEIRLTWTAPATGGDNTITLTNYQIQVSDDGATWTSPQTSTVLVDGQYAHQVAGTMQDYTHMGLGAATTKHYRVRAVNSNSVAGPWSNKAMASTPAGMPGAPTLTATKSGTSMINLGWTAPKNDGGSAITGYQLQYWDGSNGWMDLTSTAAGVTSYTHTHIAGGTTKYYRIRAMNGTGASVMYGSWSAIKFATTDTAAPNAPGLTAAADGANKITVTWTPGHDGGSPVVAFHLQVSSDRGSSWTSLGDMTDMTKSSYTHSGLTGGTTRHYRIRASNMMGTTTTRYSGWSPLASATTDTSIPGRPTLDARAGNKKVYLEWDEPATATGGSAILRYELQVWDSGKRSWMALHTSTATSYIHSGLDNDKLKFYRVRAVNRVGDGPWSTFASATPTQ